MRAALMRAPQSDKSDVMGVSRTQGAQRVAGIGTSIFSEITGLAIKHEAVNLGQGFPDFAAPDFVKQAAERHIREDRNQYAASPGVARLRRALADDWRRKQPDARAVDPDREITVGCGATELLHDALLATVDPGDEVIVLEPTYDAYGPDIVMAGGVPRPVALEPLTWRLDLDRLAAAFGPRTRARDPEHAPQPDRQGLHARGARSDRRALPAPRRARDQRRGLLRDHLRRSPHLHRDAAGDGGADDHDRQHGEDVQRHRLEGRLGDRARRR